MGDKTKREAAIEAFLVSDKPPKGWFALDVFAMSSRSAPREILCLTFKVKDEQGKERKEEHFVFVDK